LLVRPQPAITTIEHAANAQPNFVNPRSQGTVVSLRLGSVRPTLDFGILAECHRVPGIVCVKVSVTVSPCGGPAQTH
jgi:hypothetical protein